MWLLLLYESRSIALPAVTLTLSNVTQKMLVHRPHRCLHVLRVSIMSCCHDVQLLQTPRLCDRLYGRFTSRLSVFLNGTWRRLRLKMNCHHARLTFSFTRFQLLSLSHTNTPRNMHGAPAASLSLRGKFLRYFSQHRKASAAPAVFFHVRLLSLTFPDNAGVKLIWGNLHTICCCIKHLHLSRIWLCIP